MKIRKTKKKPLPPLVEPTPGKRAKSEEDARRYHHSKGVQKHPAKMKSQDTQLAQALRDRQIFELRLNGYSNGVIAERMNLTPAQVGSVVEERLKEYRGDNERMVARDDALIRAGYDKIRRTLTPLAFGGSIVDPETGEQWQLHPDKEWMRVYVKMTRDHALFISTMRPARFEVTGTAGAPVEISVTTAMAAARSMREQFGENGAIPLPMPGDDELLLPDDDAPRH